MWPDAAGAYGEDFYAGSPAITQNRFGAGSAYCVATDPEDAFLAHFAGRVLADHGITPPLEAPAGVEVAIREREVRTLLFALNHTTAVAQIPLPACRGYRALIRGTATREKLAIEPLDVAILQPL